jgi:Type IV secretion system pilin
MHHTCQRILRTAAWVAAAMTAASATGSPAYAAPDPGATGTDRLNTIIGNATGWLVGILAAVATLFLTIGGVRYVMAGGDPGEIEKAKGALKSAVLGYALAALAPIVVMIVKGILGIS